MRIAIVVHQLAGGGAEHVASLWAKGFMKQGDEVFMLLYNKQSAVVYNVNAPIIYFDSAKKNRITRLLDILVKLRTIFKRIGPDVILTVLHPIGLWSYVAAIGLGIPVIHTEHDSFERPETGPSKLTRKAKVYKFYVNKFFEAITVLTAADKRLIGKRLKRVYVMPNPLAYETLEFLPEKKNIVLAVGRVDAWYVKGFDILIKAWDTIADRYPLWELHIVGSSSEKSKEYLLGLCENERTKDQVKFVDFTLDLRPIYEEASIFVLSSRYEGFGMVLVEAMSHGCACIACDYKGRQKEIISQDEGIICLSENGSLLSNAILSLIVDDKKRKTMGKNAEMRSKAYSLSNIMENWNKIFIELKIQKNK